MQYPLVAAYRHLRNPNVEHCRQRQRTLLALRRLELSVSCAISKCKPLGWKERMLT